MGSRATILTHTSNYIFHIGQEVISHNDPFVTLSQSIQAFSLYTGNDPSIEGSICPWSSPRIRSDWNVLKVVETLGKEY